MTCSTPILWQECQSRPTPTNSAALHLISCSHITSKNPHSSPSVSIIHFLSSSSSQSIHLVGASQRGSGCCVQGILGLWRQFGNEARLHLNTLLSGHLVNLMRGGWGGRRGEMERTRGSGEREKERERARGVIATLRVQDREELKRGGGCKEGSVWRTLANINSLCKSAAQTNWQAGITPERSWIKSMKALAPLTLDLQPRPVHRSVPVMHTNDSGGADWTVTSQHIFVFLQRELELKTSIRHVHRNVNYAEKKTRERSVFSLK